MTDCPLNIGVDRAAAPTDDALKLDHFDENRILSNRFLLLVLGRTLR